MMAFMTTLPRLLLRLAPLVLLVSSSCGIYRGVYSCVSSSLGRCFDYGEVDQLPASTRCGLTTGGSLQSNACPTANRVGSCVRANDTIRYYSSSFDAATAQNACETTDGGGTFTAD
jgi:hypothetical protein